ncbi:MAG: 16S rRNA (cytidine(1402)-2'-O)-methyltransferase [Candidatus Pacebacteria bacterium]|nr:16S rRNA (cytidine(1402)-2'-O)-methyltransferase [Candidatus Paceibacterota bacterium]
MAKLYIVATPIGNLRDITQRAIETLKKVDLILSEDTRKAKILLGFLNIKKPILSYHQHSGPKKIDQVLKLLKEDKDIALISEAGTPGISDPGGKLVEITREKLKNEVEIIPIPGPSAITALASVSGISMDRFLFLGFCPKKKRGKFFQEILSSKYPVIFFESPKRILKTLKQLAQLNENLKVIVGRELTKQFEAIYTGKIGDVIKEIQETPQKGEFTIIVTQ